MKLTLALVFTLFFASISNAQCENGACLPKGSQIRLGSLSQSTGSVFISPVQKVASTVQRILPVVHNDFAYAAPVVAEASQPISGDCGCQGQCGKPGCTCAPVEVDSPVKTFAAVAMQTPVRTILRAPLRARPLQSLFRCR